jgi:ubiquinone/menaquinone biosynthesis C-methylase UbiE
MTKPRVPETDHGIQGTVNVSIYDEMQRNLRDKGWIETQAILDSGIQSGHALEIGHGPGYLGLEWLKKTRQTRLTGLDISPDMTVLAERNARSYGVEDRVSYDTGKGDSLPYPDDTFDAVFTNGSLHEWANPEGTFDEIYRVIKPGGKYFISDMRRDMSVFIRWFLWLGTKPAFIRPYLYSSIGAAYTPLELKAMIAKTNLREGNINSNSIGMIITGQKTQSD